MAIVAVTRWSTGYNILPFGRNLRVRVSVGEHFSSNFRSGKREDVNTKSSTMIS